MVAGREMLADRETQAMLIGGFLELTHNVTLGSRHHRVPARLVRRVPKVKVVMVHGHAAEILRTGLFVEREQVIRIETVSLPEWGDVFVSDLRGVPIGLHVILVLFAALHVHVAGIPVAVLHAGLRAPMRPDAELCVAVPFRHLPLSQRLAGALERAGRYGQFEDRVSADSWAALRWWPRQQIVCPGPSGSKHRGCNCKHCEGFPPGDASHS